MEILIEWVVGSMNQQLLDNLIDTFEFNSKL
jgi:hypothetical protein